jgi:hypothetical protein
VSRVDYGESSIIAEIMISRRELVYVPEGGIGVKYVAAELTVPGSSLHCAGGRQFAQSPGRSPTRYIGDFEYILLLHSALRYYLIS